jgi:dihydroneopterin aldolase
VVRLRNLQFTAPIGADAWGRPNRPQPVLVSARVSLARAFTDSSSADKVDADTVHYGLLSKAILSVVNGLGSWAEAAGSSGGGLPLKSFLDVLWVVLTGLRVDGSAPPSLPVGYEAKPFLALGSVRYLSITVQLPKASLSGGGVSLTGISLFGAAGMEMYGLTLRLHRLQVPTLIGVNSNEREAKQVVLADVEIDNFVDEGDVYPGLENAVYEVHLSFFITFHPPFRQVKENKEERKRRKRIN